MKTHVTPSLWSAGAAIERHRDAVFYLAAAVFVFVDILQITLTQSVVPGLTLARIAGIIALGLFAGIVIFYRTTGNLKVASVALIMTAYVGLVYAALKQGGAPAPTLIYAPFLPMVATVLLGRKAGMICVLISIAAISFCAYAAGAGLATPSPHSPGELRVLYTSAGIFMAVGVAVYAAIYDALITDAVSAAQKAKLALEKQTDELSESREFLGAVMDAAHDGIIAADANGKLSLFNRKAREIHGIDARPLNSEDWPSTYSLFESDGETPMSFENVPLFRAMQGEKVIGRDMAIAVPGREVQFMKANATPLYNNRGELIGAVATMQDMTIEHRQQEEIKKQNQEIDQFARVASLDLQAPLNRIIMTSEALANSPEVQASAKTRNDLAAMTTAARKMGALIKDVLYMSRLPIGEITLQPVAVRECIEAAIDHAGVNEADCRLDFRFAGSPVVTADPQRLSHVFKNLIENAWKHARTGEKAHAEFTCVIEEGTAVLGVKDDGDGMTKEQVANLFQPLENIRTDAASEGTGLGLAICLKSVARMGGEFWVEAEPGAGCHFRIRLPLAQQECPHQKELCA